MASNLHKAQSFTMRCLASPALLIFFGGVFGGNAFAQERDTNKSSDKAKRVIEKAVTIEKLFGNYHNIVDLGTLPCNEFVKIKVTLSNPNSNSFSFDFKKIELGCKCTSAEISKSEIKPGETSLLTLDLETPAASKSEERTHSVTLHASGESKERTVNLAVRYRLAGLMCFKDGAHVFDVDTTEERQKVFLPFVLTAPHDVSDIDLEITPNNPGVKATLIRKNKSHFVEVEFDTVFVDEEGLSLRIVARHSKNELQDSLSLLLCRRKRIEISPRTLRFVRSDELLRATSILRLRNENKVVEESSIGQAKQTETVSVQCNIGSLKPKVKYKRIGVGIYRITVSIDAKKMAKYLQDHPDSNTIQWDVVSTSERLATKSNFRVDDSVGNSLSLKK